MERPSKRAKPNDYQERHSAHRAEAHDFPENSYARIRGPVQHQGEGVQVVDGGFENHGDFILSHNYGVNNNHFYSTPPAQSLTTATPEEQRRTLLQSLKFPQLGAREANIKTTHSNTCEWFLKTSQFLDWIDTDKFDNHEGLLWVKGKPGAGKSTLMKFTLDRIRQSLKSKGNIVTSFFFDARGEELEHSTVGLYRSLLVQLFEARPKLLEVLDIIRPEQQWTIGSLTSLFEKVVCKAPVFCFIDALDECEEGQIREMLGFFQSVSERALSAGFRLHVCLASRHYPHISIRKGLNLVIEEEAEHHKDISKYLDGVLRIGDDDFAERIRSILHEKSSNIFMWVILVVKILNTEYDDGSDEDAIERRLHEIPSDLHELFHDILTRDENNKDDVLLCIQWVLFAIRPLEPAELYLALISGTEPDKLSKCHSKLHTSSSIDRMHRYILHNSKGLAESTKSKKPTIQFIHESVRDFLLKDNGLQKIWPGVETNFYGFGHERLRQCCFTYMRNELILDFSPPVVDLFEVSEVEATAIREEVANRFPFLEYTIHYVLRHANEAEKHTISQKDFVSTFPLAYWIKYRNLVMEYLGRPYRPGVTLLYILASRNLPELIRIHDSERSCIATEPTDYGNPLFAALATQSHAAAQALLEVELPQCPTLEGLAEKFAGCKNIADNFGRRFHFSQQQDILHYVVENGINLLLEYLLLMKDIDFQPETNGKSLLGVAVRAGNEAAVRKFLDMGVNIEASDSSGKTPLHYAAMGYYKGIVDILLEKGADTEASDSLGKTPLHYAVEGNRNIIVNILLEKGANVEASDFGGKRPLHYAAERYYCVMVNMLLEKGANTKVFDSLGKTPLRYAVERNHNIIAELLIKK